MLPHGKVPGRDITKMAMKVKMILTYKPLNGLQENYRYILERKI